MRGTHLGRLALHKGEGEGEGGSGTRLEHFEVVFFGSKAPHLIPLPFCKGRGDKTHPFGYLWRSLPREVT
jgi:hypothetical protein